uniref:Uncharacterized protein n=1 Tax=Monodelphis domestica TaxID=13616 RepID=A0A5F8HG17_MONDO
MLPMGALQPGLPSPTAIPKGFSKIVIDIKDCFFSIPLDPANSPHFAFSIPIVNHIGPNPRFAWRVLPQGMANSPTLCQKFVAQSINPVRTQFPSAYIIHYMDDLLIAAPSSHLTQTIAQTIVCALQARGFRIAPDKVQTQYPFTFLGFRLELDSLFSLKVSLTRSTLKTLNDFQKLLGDINWLRPYLQLAKADLRPLEDILRGDADPSSPRSLTPAGEASLKKVEQAIATQNIGYFSPHLPLYLLIFSTEFSPTGLLWQDPSPLIWIHLPMYNRKILAPYPDLIARLAMMGIRLSTRHFGRSPDHVVSPYNKEQLDWLKSQNDNWAILISTYQGILDNHMPSNKLLQFFTLTPFILTRQTRFSPIPGAPTVFVDGSKTGLAAIVINNRPRSIKTPYESAQLVELYAALTVFHSLPDTPFNLYSDSRYVVQSLLRLEIVPAVQPTTATFSLFSQLQQVIRERSCPFFTGHIRAHSGLPGPLSFGNDLADQHTRLAALVATTTPPPHPSTDPVSLATEAHRLHHLNSQTLRLAYKITREQARSIVKGCKNCVTLLPEPHLGINPRGLLPGHLWQMDVTHVPSFARLKYVHVSIDTFSGFLFASAQSGEATKHVIKHMFLAMSIMGKPLSIKTDNGPGYTSQAFKQFCPQLGIKHVQGIPYNPQGQGIVERAHQTLKNTLFKLKTQETFYPLCGNQTLLLAHALFVLNFLTLDAEGRSAADRHWHPHTPSDLARVLWRDPLTGLWQGPDPVLTWGKGSACIFDAKANNARWVPSRLIKTTNIPSP